MTYYSGVHFQQTDFSWITKTSGCTWTSVSAGIAATSGGTHHPSPDNIHSLLPRSQETNPETPGWSIPDAVRAVDRYSVDHDYPIRLVNKSGGGWAAVLAQLLGGHYVVLQGDSDQFGNNTCSGAFNGDHCVGVSPRTRYFEGHRQFWIDDPICPAGRWEYESVLRRYAEDLDSRIRFGAFLQKVPVTGYRVKVRRLYRFWRYLPDGSRQSKVSLGGFSATCTAPSTTQTDSGPKRLVTVTSGAYNTWRLDADATPITVTEA